MGSRDENFLAVTICPATGGQMAFLVPKNTTVAQLKDKLEQTIGIPRNRVNLLYKERLLVDGHLHDYGLVDGSTLTLLPSVDSGLMTNQHSSAISNFPTRHNLQNLSDKQISDFLSGKSQLTFSIHLGDHTMFVQLQLSSMQIIRGSANVSSLSSSPPPSSSTSTSTASSVSSSSSSSSSLSSSSSSPSSSLSSMSSSSSSLSFSRTSKPTSNSAVGDTCDNRFLQSTNNIPCFRRKQLGAVIESFQPVGNGMYSGRFSGVLNSSPDDVRGRSRSGIQTVVSILNDFVKTSSSSWKSSEINEWRLLRNQLTHPEGLCRTPNNDRAKRFHQSEEDERKVKRRSRDEVQEENRATHQKMERVQRMLQQQKLRRQARTLNQSVHFSRKNFLIS